MELEHYFDILHANDIRIKGTRMGIETILYDYIHQQRTAEEIAQTYPQLTLEKSTPRFFTTCITSRKLPSTSQTGSITVPKSSANKTKTHPRLSRD